MAWILVVVAGLLEVLWAYSMKQSQGFTRLAPSLMTLAGMAASFALLSLSMKSFRPPPCSQRASAILRRS